VLVLAPGQDDRELGPDDTLDGGEVLPGFTLALDDLFAQTRVSKTESQANASP
jgi:hypothetical protein